MSTEENKALARRLYEEVFNRGNLDAAEELVTGDFLPHDPSVPEEFSGPEGLKQFAAMYRSVFPDLNIAVEDQVAEADKVVTRFTASGTHQGELMGVAPTGSRVEISGISLHRISGSRIAEDWANYDALGMMRQIGAIPAPEQAGA